MDEAPQHTSTPPNRNYTIFFFCERKKNCRCYWKTQEHTKIVGLFNVTLYVISCVLYVRWIRRYKHLIALDENMSASQITKTLKSSALLTMLPRNQSNWLLLTYCTHKYLASRQMVSVCNAWHIYRTRRNWGQISYCNRIQCCFSMEIG